MQREVLWIVAGHDARGGDGVGGGGAFAGEDMGEDAPHQSPPRAHPQSRAGLRYPQGPTYE